MSDLLPGYLAYAAATAALVLTPGSTTAVVVRNTLDGGHRAGLMAAAGAALANSTHATLAGLGLWVLLGRWPEALQAVRLGGAAYLAWLGVRSLRRAITGGAVDPAPARPDPSRAVRHRPALAEGVIVNLLNPAIIGFYLAVVPSFVPAAAPRGYFALLAATHVTMALACHAAWVRAFHVLRVVFARPGVARGVDALTAAALFWLAGRVVGQV